MTYDECNLKRLFLLLSSMSEVTLSLKLMIFSLSLRVLRERV